MCSKTYRAGMIAAHNAIAGPVPMMQVVMNACRRGGRLVCLLCAIGSDSLRSTREILVSLS